MSSVCISTCVKDACGGDPRIPVRATYVNLYKWPESDAEFVRSMSSRMSCGGGGGSAARHGHPSVVDSISCRQMYLRSYPFNREEEKPEKARCLGKFGREGKGGRRRRGDRDQERRCMELKRVKEASWKAVFRIFHRLLSCSASVDVADQSKDF